MHLDDNPFLIGIPIKTQNFILACYATFLFLGHTLLCKLVKTRIVKRYIAVVCALFMRNGHFSLQTNEMGGKAAIIKLVFIETTRWGKNPSRREPLTPETVRLLNSIAAVDESDYMLAAVVD